MQGKNKKNTNTRTTCHKWDKGSQKQGGNSKAKRKKPNFREGLRLELQLDKDACGVGIGAATGKEVSGGAAAENGKTKWNSEGLRLRKKKK